MVKHEDDSILTIAYRIVRGERQDSYGDPHENIKRVADLWTAYLGTVVTARDVCLMMILMKCSRDRHAPKNDNLIDIAGYAELAGLLNQEPKE